MQQSMFEENTKAVDATARQVVMGNEETESHVDVEVRDVPAVDRVALADDGNALVEAVDVPVEAGSTPEVANVFLPSVIGSERWDKLITKGVSLIQTAALVHQDGNMHAYFTLLGNLCDVYYKLARQDYHRMVEFEEQLLAEYLRALRSGEKGPRVERLGDQLYAVTRGALARVRGDIVYGVQSEEFAEIERQYRIEKQYQQKVAGK